jgi:hypothetical protein
MMAEAVPVEWLGLVVSSGRVDEEEKIVGA